MYLLILIYSNQPFTTYFVSWTTGDNSKTDTVNTVQLFTCTPMTVKLQA